MSTAAAKAAAEPWQHVAQHLTPPPPRRYKRYIVPLLSLSVDFYVRVFLRVYTSPGTAKDSATKLAYLYQSQGCDSFYMQVGGRGGWRLLQGWLHVCVVLVHVVLAHVVLV